jgi:Toprim domain
VGRISYREQERRLQREQLRRFWSTAEEDYQADLDAAHREDDHQAAQPTQKWAPSRPKITESGDATGFDYATLADLRGGEEGALDHACPLCGPGRHSEYNRARPVLRTWEPSPGFITFYCVRCEAKGYVHADGSQRLRSSSPRRQAPPPPDDTLRLAAVEQFWGRASPALPANVVAYFRWRGIELAAVPAGVFRWHRCGEILARYSDPITGALKGVWRRPVDGSKPTALGPMGGGVIRLFPEITDRRLVIAEGVETALAAATRITHRGEPLRPTWATGCAGNMKRFPVIDGVARLIILVDNDASETGQRAAEECACRWGDAGREVIRLLPRKLGTDFNDLVRR